jgi:hypothetical protein
MRLQEIDNAFRLCLNVTEEEASLTGVAQPSLKRGLS